MFSYFKKPLSLIIGTLVFVLWIAAAVVMWIFAPATRTVFIRILSALIILLGTGAYLLSLPSWCERVTFTADSVTTKTLFSKKNVTLPMSALGYAYFITGKDGAVKEILLSGHRILPKDLEKEAYYTDNVVVPYKKFDAVTPYLSKNILLQLEKKAKSL